MSKSKKRPAADDIVSDPLAVGTEWVPTDATAQAIGGDLVDIAQGRQTAPNPLDAVAYTGNGEEDSRRELAAIQSGFAARAAQEAERLRATTDSEYWFCVCFQSRAQKHAFLEAMGWKEEWTKYVDGVEVARRLGIVLPSANGLRFVAAKPDRALSDLALPLEGES